MQVSEHMSEEEVIDGLKGIDRENFLLRPDFLVDAVMRRERVNILRCIVMDLGFDVNISVGDSFTALFTAAQVWPANLSIP